MLRDETKSRLLTCRPSLTSMRRVGGPLTRIWAVNRVASANSVVARVGRPRDRHARAHLLTRCRRHGLLPERSAGPLQRRCVRSESGRNPDGVLCCCVSLSCGGPDARFESKPSCLDSRSRVPGSADPSGRTRRGSHGRRPLAHLHWLTRPSSTHGRDTDLPQYRTPASVDPHLHARSA